MKFLIILALLGLAFADKVRYDNYKVYHVTPFTDEHVKMLRELQSSSLGVSFWDEHIQIGQSADIMLPPHLQGDLIDQLEAEGLSVSEFITNVQKLIDEQNDDENPQARLTFTAYHRYAAIQEYLREQANSHPRAELVTIGKTFENRDIMGIVINRVTPRRPIIIVEAGIHAREWIAGATANYLINELLNGMDPLVRAWADDYEWHIIPIANPDGFEYSHTHDRLWRKTRSIRPGTTCRGCDPNRNWGFKWGTGGSSSQPCDDTYMGIAPFSEPETKAISDYISALPKPIAFYLDLHSYSQLIMYPYGVREELPPGEKELWHGIGEQAAEALIAVHGTNFTVGNIVDLLYPASGGSVDWVKGTYLDTRLVLVYELRDKGDYGFLLPAKQIIESGEEFIASLKPVMEALPPLLP